MTLKIPLFWGLKGGMQIIRTGSALIGIWTYARHHGLEEHLVDGVKDLPAVFYMFVEMAVSELIDLITPRGDRA